MLFAESCSYPIKTPTSTPTRTPIPNPICTPYQVRCVFSSVCLLSVRFATIQEMNIGSLQVCGL